jgi:hypothetical protein
MLMRVRDNEAVAMDTRLEELVSIFARNPRTALANGGPDLEPLPWDGLDWKGDDLVARANTFEVFCTSLALRDYRFPLGAESQPQRTFASILAGRPHDRVFDGVAIAWGPRALTSVADVEEAVTADPDGTARILFVQAQISDQIPDADVERFGGNVLGFLTQPDYAKGGANEQVKTWRAIYDALWAATGGKLLLDVLLVFMFPGERANFFSTIQVRDRILETLSNHKDLVGVRFGMEISDLGDVAQAAMLAGLGIQRSLKNVRAVPFTDRTAAKGYLAIVPGEELVKALAAADTDFDADEIVLDPQFFLENPRHDLGDEPSENAGAGALARDIQDGKQAQAFVCHNGITIVARHAELKGGDTIVMTTPQVVNGCQSSYALGRLGSEVAGTDFVVKIVATDDERLKDAIVLGANTQQEIEAWDLLARRRFVRELEREFDRNWQNRLWLERRHRWRDVWEEAGAPANPEYILTPRQLLDGFAASILGRAHAAHTGAAQVLPLVQEVDDKAEDKMGDRARAKARIFAEEHEPALYRAVGWMIAAGRMWGQTERPSRGEDDESRFDQYHYRHHFVGALWRIADADPDRVEFRDLARGRDAQDRATALIERLADKSDRRQLSKRAGEAVRAAIKKAPAAFEALRKAGKVKVKRMPDPAKQAWFTDLVRAEADARRLPAGGKGWWR